MLLEVSTAISHALCGRGPDLNSESDGDFDGSDEEDPLIEDDSDADMWSTVSPARETQQKALAINTSVKTTPSEAVKARIRSDLKLTKEAGFKVGILGDLNLGGILCISIRIAKLGISDEAMNAWGLKRNHYLVLLIRYASGYKNINEIKEEAASAVAKTEFRVALCQQYKPSVPEAVNAFNQLPGHSEKSKASDRASLPKPAVQAALGALEPLFIGRPLNDVLTRLPAILKYRVACSFSWTGAELFFNEIQAKAANSINTNNPAFMVSDHPASQALPKIVTADHVGEVLLPWAMSFPLAAMQFVLRHFVRCTEFCLVCHCKIDSNFEALKPYVCSKPLCLFQYMALGFGPSIEWEILSQPYVVDLLVSFCYASAQGGRLKTFPIGIDLKVPVVPPTDSVSSNIYYQSPSIISTAPSTPSDTVMPRPTSTRFDVKTRELIFSDSKPTVPLKIGDWIVVNAKKIDGQYHARVEENFLSTVRLGELIHVPTRYADAMASKVVPPVGWVDAEYYVYNQNFDALSDQEKQNAITCVLDTLPDVMEMKALLEGDSQEPSLKRFRDKISDAALNLLRWIIASNRSCIMQVDRMSSSPSSAGAEDRVSGMAEWMQFRFAQGAPDKEQRFMDCVKEVSTRLKIEKYPTIFAWHGSPLANWHSIVREGLHFKDTLHGRAYGNGVYMSAQASTSFSYAGTYPYHRSEGNSSTNWRNSKLCVSGAIALNEVVNAPQEFVNHTPHYVVNQIDWIQTRYLFVKGAHRKLGHDFGKSSPPKCTYEQDPKHTAVDEYHKAIIIPITAISKSRRPTMVTSPLTLGTKKAKVTGSTTQEQAERAEDDAASMMTDTSDINYLFSDDEDDNEDDVTLDHPSAQKDTSTPEQPEPPKTDFIPGQLSASSLPLLAPPSHASTSATKALLSTLKQTLQIQNTTPLHELGWYIPEDLITNIYQWIVELHSFDPALPLAKDMVAAGLKSIILEIRFSNDFPIAPPFVRVIRPRFLPFMHGGGGHVTAGGALCMELLTNSGWSPVSSVESVLLQVRMAMSSLEPKPARLMRGISGGGGGGGRNIAGRGMYGGGSTGGAGDQYSVGEAVEAYKRACHVHGWAVPKEFDEFLGGLN